MPNLIELTSKIVASHAKKSPMSQEQLLQDMHLIHAALQLIEQGVSQEQQSPVPEEPKAPTLTIKQAFKKDEVVCMICGKGGFKTLTRHLKTVHDIKPGQYRKQFGIKGTQKLAAKSFTEARRQAAEARGMKDILAKAREIRMANLEEKKANVPAVKAKAAVPAVRKKAATPVVKKQAQVPAKVTSKQ